MQINTVRPVKLEAGQHFRQKTDLLFYQIQVQRPRAVRKVWAVGSPMVSRSKSKTEDETSASRTCLYRKEDQGVYARVRQRIRIVHH